MDLNLGGERPPTMEFLADGGISGFAGCNRYFGKSHLAADGSVRVEITGTTRMACPRAQMQLEQRFLALVAQAPNVGVRDTFLELRTETGEALLVFTPER